jgi:hypothetical protein
MFIPLLNFCKNIGGRINQWTKPTTATFVAASLTDYAPQQSRPNRRKCHLAPTTHCAQPPG